MQRIYVGAITEDAEAEALAHDAYRLLKSRAKDSLLENKFFFASLRQMF